MCSSISHRPPSSLFFFFNDPPPPEIYTLSLHDALPICPGPRPSISDPPSTRRRTKTIRRSRRTARSEEHTSELQSPMYLVCRLLLEKKKKNKKRCTSPTNKIISQQLNSKW